jgi:hypothetical protein
MAKDVEVAEHSRPVNTPVKVMLKICLSIVMSIKLGIVFSRGRDYRRL